MPGSDVPADRGDRIIDAVAFFYLGQEARETEFHTESTENTETRNQEEFLFLRGLRVKSWLLLP
jgi:hypothetical protein